MNSIFWMANRLLKWAETAKKIAKFGQILQIQSILCIINGIISNKIRKFSVTYFEMVLDRVSKRRPMPLIGTLIISTIY